MGTALTIAVILFFVGLVVFFILLARSNAKVNAEREREQEGGDATTDTE